MAPITRYLSVLALAFPRFLRSPQPPSLDRARLTLPRCCFLFPRFNVFIRIRVIPLCFFHYLRPEGLHGVTGKNRELGGKRPAEEKKRGGKKWWRLFLDRATRTMRHPRFNLTSHLCYCETTRTGDRGTPSNRTAPVAGDSADVSRLSVSLLSGRFARM